MNRPKSITITEIIIFPKGLFFIGAHCTYLNFWQRLQKNADFDGLMVSRIYKFRYSILLNLKLQLCSYNNILNGEYMLMCIGHCSTWSEWWTYEGISGKFFVTTQLHIHLLHVSSFLLGGPCPIMSMRIPKAPLKCSKPPGGVCKSD